MKKIISLFLITVLVIGAMSTSVFASSRTGPGGRSSIVEVGGELEWQVRPNTGLPYEFIGEVTYDATGNVYPVDRIGLGGGYVGGTAPEYGSKNTAYYAYLTGTATDLDGTSFNVLPGVGIWYTVR